MNVGDKIDPLLARYDLRPVLVDVGASGGAPQVWQPIARRSVYVGFDPDLRELKKDTEGAFRTAFMVNKALCADADADAVTFYLTHSPYCSSMLEPDNEALASYSFWKLFEVSNRIPVPATTLSKIMQELSLAQIDWLKIDAQGADLRIYRSLHDDARRRIIAVDTEPGLIDAYRGEDLFVDVHKQLRAEGFWLSNLNVMGAPRISRPTMEALAIRPTSDGIGLESARLRPSPGWCEARYFRSTDWLRDNACGGREFILAWVFAVLDGQFGHALDVAQALKGELGGQDIGDWLVRDALELLRSDGSSSATQSAPRRRGRALYRIGRMMRGLLGR